MHSLRFVAFLSIPVLVGACTPKTAPVPTVSERNIGSPAGDVPGSGIAPKNRKTRPGEKPVPPLLLAVPTAQPGQVDGKNLKQMEQGELLARAYGAMGNQDYAKAAAFQYWYVQKSKTGQYNLACFLAQIGEVDPAFYWLQHRRGSRREWIPGTPWWTRT
jgi:hypothetical protein